MLEKGGPWLMALGSYLSWWRHQMKTFSALLALCAGNSPVTGKFPSQRPVTRSFDVVFDLCPNKGMSKQSWGWWFETPSRSLWHYCTVLLNTSDSTSLWIMDATTLIRVFHLLPSSVDAYRFIFMIYSYALKLGHGCVIASTVLHGCNHSSKY